MATWMTTRTSEVHSHGRSDPEYFLPQHTRIAAELQAVTTVALGQLGTFTCSAFYPAATHLYCDEGIPFLRCVDIIDYPIISPDQPFARIPNSFVGAHPSVRTLCAQDLIISKVGTPCYASLLAANMPRSAMTRTVLGMSNIRRDLVDPYYLLAFLRSRYGFDQLMRERELTIQYQLTLERTRKIRIHLPDEKVQRTIGALVVDHYEASRESAERFTSAQSILRSELALARMRQISPIGYTTSFNEVEESRRFDAEHYLPTFREFVAHLPQGIKLVPLSHHHFAKRLNLCAKQRACRRFIFTTPGITSSPRASPQELTW